MAKKNRLDKGRRKIEEEFLDKQDETNNPTTPMHGHTTAALYVAFFGLSPVVKGPTIKHLNKCLQMNLIPFKTKTNTDTHSKTAPLMRRPIAFGKQLKHSLLVVAIFLFPEGPIPPILLIFCVCGVAVGVSGLKGLLKKFKSSLGFGSGTFLG